MTERRLQADFNGLFRAPDTGSFVLCLSHGDSCLDEDGVSVVLEEGMRLTAFDQDADEYGNPDNLVASGVVARTPEWLEHSGSRWVLVIDENGVRNESEL